MSKCGTFVACCMNRGCLLGVWMIPFLSKCGTFVAWCMNRGCLLGVWMTSFLSKWYICCIIAVKTTFKLQGAWQGVGYKFQLHHAHREDKSFPMRYHTYVFGEGKDSSRTRFLSPHFGLGLFSDSDFFRTRTQVGLVFSSPHFGLVSSPCESWTREWTLVAGLT